MINGKFTLEITFQISRKYDKQNLFLIIVNSTVLGEEFIGVCIWGITKDSLTQGAVCIP